MSSEPGRPFFWGAGNAPARLALAHDVPAFAWLAETFGLAGFDLDVMLALAPELDLRYERLYAYLQDDVTRKRPTVDLALNLFSSHSEEKLALRSRFAPDAPLARHELVRIFPDPSLVQPPLLAHFVRLDEQIVRLLLGHCQLDPRLADFARLAVPAAPGATTGGSDTSLAGRLAAMALGSQQERRSLRLYFEGNEAAGKLRAADAVARAIGARVLVVNLTQAVEATRDFRALLRLVFREAWLQEAVLFLDGVDTLGRDERSAGYQALLEPLAVQPGVVILSSTEPWRPSGRALGVLVLRFGALDRAAAGHAWEEQLAEAGVRIEPAGVELLADRYRLTPDQIADAVACAANRARLRAAASARAEARVSAEDLCAAARAESGHALERLARKIEPCYAWSDIVLPEEQLEQLREVCDQAKHWRRVFGDWGFDRKLSLGKGLNVLFSRPPGTGKTVAAEVISSDLQLDLYKIDLSQVVSKYIGETEKNLDRIFSAAENSNAFSSSTRPTRCSANGRK